MDLDDFRSLLGTSGVDIWTLIHTAVTVAMLDYGAQLKDRRDGIIAKLYAKFDPVCRNCHSDRITPTEKIREPESSPEQLTPVSVDGGRSDDDDGGGNDIDRAIEDEKNRILDIREQIHDPDQSEDSLVDLLKTLADMDITFRGLQDTDIGRDVNRLRKHPSADVRRLVKILVRKWKDIVDEWVSSNTPRDGELQASALIAEEDSPQLNSTKTRQNSHHQVPDFGYSPNPHNGNAGFDRIYSEPESKMKIAPARRDPPTKSRANLQGGSPSAPPLNRQKEVKIDQEKLASARKRL